MPPVPTPRIPRWTYWVGVLLLVPGGVFTLALASMAAGELAAYVALLTSAVGLIALGVRSVVRDRAVVAMTPGSRRGWILGGLAGAGLLGGASCVAALLVALSIACDGGC